MGHAKTKIGVSSVKRAIRYCGILVFVVLALPFLLFPEKKTEASVYKAFNYQGKLLDASSIAVADGNYSITFLIYDSLAGGSCIWSARGTCGVPTAKTIAVSGGIFSTMLGESGDVALPDFTSDSYFLEIRIDYGGTPQILSPRKRIGSVPQALNANALVGDGVINLTSGATTTNAAAITVNSLTTGNGLSISSTSLTSGALINLSVNSTTATSNTQTGLKIATAGANGSATQTTYGGLITNTHTGTTSTNYGLHITASGGTNNIGLYTTASGGTNNYAAIFDAGSVGIGTTTPLAKLAINGGLHVGGDSDPGDNNLLVDGTTTSTGLITATAGLTANGALIANSTFTLGDAGDAGSVNTNTWGITTAGAASGLTTITASGEITSGGYLNLTNNNLLYNGDFETGTTDGWSGITAIATGGYAGNYTAEITGYHILASDDYIPVDPTYDVLQLETYVKKTVAGTTPGTLYFGYYAYDASKTIIGTAPCGSFCYFAAAAYVVPVDSTWHKFSATTTGEGTVFPNFPVGTKFIRVMGLVNFNGSGDTVMQIDHIVLKRINNGPLFVGNNFSSANLIDQFQVSKIYTTSTNGLNFTSPSDGDYIFNGAGNVGIGNTAPANKLTIGPNIGALTGFNFSVSGTDGTMFAQSTSVSGYSGQNMYNENGVLAASFQYGNASAGSFPNTMFLGTRIANAPLVFVTAGANERARISATGGLSVGTAAWNGTDPGAGNVLIQGNVGIGTTTLTDLLSIYKSGDAAKEVITSSAGQAVLELKTYRDSVLQGYVGFYGARGTDGVPVVVQNNDRLGYVWAGGYSAAAAANIVASGIKFEVDGVPDTAGDTTDMPGRITFWTTPNGSGTVAEAMRIDNAGNVGIGTTAPNQPLVVAGSDATNPIIAKIQNIAGSPSGGAKLIFGTSNTITVDTVGAELFAIRTDTGGSGSTDLAFSTSLATTMTEYMRIKASGNVGIGIATPGAKLDIAAAASAVEAENIRFSRIGDNARYNSIYSYSMDAGAAYLQFRVHDGVTTTSQASVMTLKGTGNVGIGTTAPDRKLEINTGAATGGLRLTYNDSNGSATVYSDMLVDSAGDLAITATGGDISFDNENLVTTGTGQFARLGLGVAPHATDILSVTSASTTSSSKGLNVSHTGAVTTGSAIGYAGYFSKTGGSTYNIGLFVESTGATTNYGVQVGAMTGATSNGFAIVSMSGATANYGVNIGPISGDGTGASILTYTMTNIGARANQINLGGITGANGTNHAAIIAGDISGLTPLAYGISLGTLTGGTTSNYQINTGDVTKVANATNAQLNLGAVSGPTAASTNYGINVGLVSGTGTVNYGLYVSGASGATANYAAIFDAGNVGIGITTPTTALNVKSGSTTYKQLLLENTSSQKIYSGGVADTVGSYISGNAYYSSSFEYIPSYTAASGIEFRNTGNIEFFADSGLTAGVQYNPTERMVIDTSGGIDWTAGNTTYVPIGGDINAYITAATAGDTLVLAAGTYTVTSTVNVTKALRIKGQGTGATTVSRTATNYIFLITASNVQISDMSVSMAVDSSTAYVINASGASGDNLTGIIIENIDMTLSGASTSFIGVGVYDANAIIRNVRITGTIGGGSGIRVQNDSSAEAATNSYIYNSSVDLTNSAGNLFGIYVYDNAGNPSSYDINAYFYDCNIKVTEAASAGVFAINSYGTYAKAYLYGGSYNATPTDYDLVQSNSAALTVYGVELVNNTTSGTITYGGGFASGSMGLGVAPSTTSIGNILSASTTASSKGLNVSHTGAIAGTGYGGYFAKTGASTTNVGLQADASGATTNYGLYSVVSGAATTNVGAYVSSLGGTTNYGVQVASMTGATSYGLWVGNLSGATANYGVNIGTISSTGTAAAITTGAISGTGATAYHLNLGTTSGANATAHAGINIGNVSGATVRASGIILGTLTGGTTSNYQMSTGIVTKVANSINAQLGLGGVSGDAAGSTNYGIYFGGASGTGTVNYGLYVGAVSGATANWGIYVAGGTGYFGSDIQLAQIAAPAPTTDKLYNVAGGLYWNGINLTGGGALPSGTSGQTLRHDGASWVANSILTNDGTNIGISSRLGVGVAPSANYTIYASEIFTMTAGAKYGIRADQTLSPSGVLTSSTTAVGMEGSIIWDSAVDGSTHGTIRGLGAFAYTLGTASGALNGSYGIYQRSVHRGSGTLSSSFGVYSVIENDDVTNETGDITNAYNYYAYATTDKGTGVIGARYGLYVATTSGGGLLTNQYGIYIADQTSGTNDYGLAIAGADTQVLWLSSGTDSTDAANGIAFGSSRDTNLYRSAANTLTTDDSLTVGDDATVTDNLHAARYQTNTWYVDAGDNIPSVYALASDGDVIILGPGTHTLATSFSISKQITLKGSGRDRTNLTFTNTSSISLRPRVSNITIEDMTLTNVSYNGVGSYLIYADNAVAGTNIANLRINRVDLVASQAGTGELRIINLAHVSGTFEDITISGTSTTATGSVIGIYVYQDNNMAGDENPLYVRNSRFNISNTAGGSCGIYANGYTSPPYMKTVYVENSELIADDGGATKTSVGLITIGSNMTAIAQKSFIQGAADSFDVSQANTSVLTLAGSTLGNGTTTGTITYDHQFVAENGYFSTAMTTAASKGLYVIHSGATTTGYAGYFDKTGASTTNVGVQGNASGATTNYGLYSVVSGAATTNAGIYLSSLGGTTNYGVQVAAMTGATSYGLSIGNLSGATANYGLNIGTISDAGTAAAITTGAISSTGATAYQLNLGGISGANATAHAGINIGNVSGATVRATGIILGTLTGGTTSNYQMSTGIVTKVANSINAQLTLGGVSGDAAGSTNYGINVNAVSGTGTVNYGLYVGSVSGATANYAAIFAGGNVGIGTVGPTVKLHVASSDGTSIIAMGDTQAGTSAAPVETALQFRGYTNQIKAEIAGQDQEGSFHGGWLVFRTSDSSEVLQDRIIIDRAGNVGIGTIAPLSKLSINGGLHVGGDSDAGDNNLLVDGTTTSTGLISANGGVTVAANQNLTMNAGTGIATLPKIAIQRSANVASGINWYNSATYTAWTEYMGPAGTASQGPTANITAPTGTYVTSWGLRSFIENTAGYGWTWESGTSAQTTPAIIAELSSVTGNFLTIGGGTFAGALAANGGITFDSAADTVGAHTLSGTLDANTNIITNIGNAGTDFVASTGALTLAGVLTANGGVTVAANQNLTLTSGTGTYTQTYTGTTTTAATITANSITSGKGLSIASSSLSSGSLVDFTVTGTAAASNTQKGINISTSGANATSTQTTYGGYIANTHTGTESKNIGLYVEASGGTGNYAIQAVGGALVFTASGADANYSYENVLVYHVDSSSQVGAMVINLPEVPTSSMLNIKITGYDYVSSGGAWEVVIGGYWYVNTFNWLNTSAEIRGSSPFKRVRLMKEGNAPRIVLGETTDTWQNPQMRVDVSIAGYGGQANWGNYGATNWSSALSADISALTASNEPTIKMFMTTAGDLGIGTTAATHKLQVTDTSTTASRAGLYVAQSGAITGTGYAGYFIKTGASTINVGVNVAATGGTTNYLINGEAMTGATNYGVAVGNLSGATANTGLWIGTISSTGTAAAITTGAISGTGATAYHLNLGAISGANATSHTGISLGNISGTTPLAKGINLGTLTGGTTSNYQLNTGIVTKVANATNAQLNLGAVSGNATSSTNYGINVGAVSGTGTANYGLYLGAVSGATANYSMYAAGGTAYFADGTSIATGESYTGAGTVTLSSAAASALTIDSGTTGAIGIGTGANAKILTIGNVTTTTALVFNTGTGGITMNLIDNDTDQLDIQEGANNYLNINTTNASEAISFGNTTTNPTFYFVGSGNVGIGMSTGTAAKLHITQATLGSEAFRIESTATNDDPNYRVFQNRLVTTNATPTALYSVDLSGASWAGRTVLFEARVVAKVTGIPGANGGASYIRKASFMYDGATLNQYGTTVDDFTGEMSAAWDCTIDNTGNTVRVLVTGAAANITWHSTVIVQDVAQ